MKLELENEILFVYPNTLLNQVVEILNKVGAEKFFSSPNEEVKKAREGFCAYFFALTLKKYFKSDWCLAQYDQATRAYPDFDFISFSENPNDIKIEAVELTGIYPHFKSFEEALNVIKKKQKKYENKPVKFSLLIFVNHEKSEEWINRLRNSINDEKPFLSIWTIHLIFKKDGKEIEKAISQRIVPMPYLRVEAYTSDPEIHKQLPLPSYMKKYKDNDRVCITFKKEFMDKIGYA